MQLSLRFTIYFVGLLVSSGFLPVLGKVAPVVFKFNVPPSKGMFVPVYKTEDARDAFPDEDMFITQISFKGVFANGNDDVIPFHDALKVEHSESLDLVFHHTLLHQGSSDETHEKWAHFTEKDDSTWSHGAIIFGTSLKTISYKPFGTRLRRNVADIYSCIHAKNNKDFPVDFVAEWEIEYEVMNSPEPDPRSMITGWYVQPYFNPNQEAGTEDASIHVLVENDLVMRKSAKLLGWVIHHHKWLYEVDVKVNNHTLFAIGKGKDTDPIPENDGEIHWFRSKEYNLDLDRQVEDANGNLSVIIGDHSTNEYGYDVYEGESLRIEVIAGNPTAQTKGPLGISFYFHCHDGSDRLVNAADLFQHYADHPIDDRDPVMQKKVDDWNKKVIKKLARASKA